MESLPDCIMLRIFKEIDSKTDLWKARQVCRRWHQLLADPDLWKICDFSVFKLNDLSLMKEVSNYTPLQALQFLDIKNSVVLTDVLHIILKRAENLQGVRLSGCTIHPLEELEAQSICDDVAFAETIAFLDMRKTIGSFDILKLMIKIIGRTLKVLGISNYFGMLRNIGNASFLSYLPNLTTLECLDCVWMNDEYINEVAKYCPSLRSLNISHCLNVHGTTLTRVINKCEHLNTLILRRTGVRDEMVYGVLKWSGTNIQEIDISHCYYIGDEALNKLIIELLPQLEYLCCAITDEIINAMTSIKLKLRTFELRRRHPVNTDNIVELLKRCVLLEHLDISLTPMDDIAFKNFLPKLKNLKWLSIAGHEVLKTHECLKLVASHCHQIEAIGVNYYQALEDPYLESAIFSLIHDSKYLTKISLEGTNLQDCVQRIKDRIEIDKLNNNLQNIEIIRGENFQIPPPKLCVNNYAKKLNCYA